MDPGEDGFTVEQYAQLIDQVSDVITIVDADGMIKYQSSGSQDVKGWSAEELIGDNIFEYIHPDDRDHVREHFETLASDSGRIQQTIEFRFQHKDRDWIWLAVTGTAPQGDLIDGYITTSRDITDRKRRERTLQLLNQIVRHDIRNNLQVITGYGETLTEHIDEEGQQALRQLLTSAQEAIEITETAKDVAEVVLRTGTEPTPVALKPVIQQEVEDLRSYNEQAQITIDGAIPAVSVQADELLSAVIRNLLTNAVEHNNKDTPQVTVRVTKTDGQAEIMVADNGPGIPAALRETIFEEGETGLESEGTGIGLYLVETLVSGYGGTVTIQDNDPTGTVFTVSLPLTGHSTAADT